VSSGPQPFLSDIQELRRRAREHISQGAVTPGYHADRDTVVKLLNEALATEIVCTLRYKRHYFMAKGIHAEGVAAEFLEHAHDEQQHADQIAARITQLGGAPDFSPDGLATRSHAEYVEGDSLEDDQGRPGGRAHRDRQLQGDHPVPRRERSDLAPADGGHPGEGRGARR
jgi:bacterioferritin